MLSLKSESPKILQSKLILYLRKSFLFENNLILGSDILEKEILVKGWEKSFISFPYGRIPTVCTATTCLPFNLYPYMYAARY